MNTKHLSINLSGFFALVLTVLVLLQSCAKKDKINPADGSKPPVIVSFAPATGAKDTTVIIKGANFNTTPGKNLVTFNSIPAIVAAATTSSLTVKVPAGAGTGKIAIHEGIYGVSTAADFKYEYTVTTLAGSNVEEFADGRGNAAHFWLPYGITLGASGDLFVADFANSRIREITPGGDVSTLVKNLGGTAAGFYNPSGVATDNAGNVYVADSFNRTIRKITPAGLVIDIAGAGPGSPGTTDGKGAAARFRFPLGVVVDAAGNVYVSDVESNRIRKITPDGSVSTFAGNGTAGRANGIGISAEFNAPKGLAIDAAGNLYVADFGNNLVRKITPVGVVTTVAGDGNNAFKDGPAAIAEFQLPSGVAVDASGNIYIADTGNHRIRKITHEGIVSTLAGNNFGFADGAARLAQFFYPTGVAVDASGDIYVADSGNNRIRKLQ